MVRQQLGLDLGAGAELAIEAFMAAPFLQQQVIFQGHPGEVGHQLAMAAMHIAPARATGRAEHVKASPLETAGHHRGADQGPLTPMLGHHLIQAGHQAGLTRRGQQAGVVEADQLAEQVPAAFGRSAMELLAPQASIGMEGQQQGPLGLHQASCHQGH